MQKKLLVAALGTLFAMPVLAADAPAAAPAPAVTGNFTVTTNYIFRGLTQTNNKPALQGGFDYAHESGFYAGVWGSSISWITDQGTANSSQLELDTYFGLKNSFATDFSYDVGFLRYNYPATYPATMAAVGNAKWVKADTNEVYGQIGYKFVTLKYSQSLGDTFALPNASGTSYVDLSASYPLADSGVTLGAHYGKQSYKGVTADALKAAGTDPSYSDYKLSVSKDFSGYAVALAYSATNTKDNQFYSTVGLPGNNVNTGKSAVVLSVTRTF